MVQSSECPDGTRNQLAWQCRRGMRELDELLKSFLDQHLNTLDGPGLEAFATLLKYPDAVLLEFLMGRMAPSDREVADIVRKIRNTAVP